MPDEQDHPKPHPSAYVEQHAPSWVREVMQHAANGGQEPQPVKTDLDPRRPFFEPTIMGKGQSPAGEPFHTVPKTQTGPGVTYCPADGHRPEGSPSLKREVIDAVLKEQSNRTLTDYEKAELELAASPLVPSILRRVRERFQSAFQIGGNDDSQN